MSFRQTLVIVWLLAPALACAEWSFTDQAYSCKTSGMTFQELASAGVTYVSHVPATEETAREAHRWGVRIMPYVSLYKVVDSSENPSLADAPFWGEIDLVDHPDWVLIREDGERRRPFNRPDYPAGFHQSCCNQPGIAEAYVRGVENVLALGADGVFVDNVHPYPKCFGPELGIHEHLDPDASNTEMYRRALMRVYRAVKAHGAQFAVMLNSGHPSHDYIGFGDSLMWESFIFRHGFTGDEGDLSQLRRVDDWAEVRRAYEDWREFTEAGGSIAPLTYLPTRDLEKPHAFLAYACAKLCGFQQWTGTAGERQDILRQLYRTDTGRPLEPLREHGPVLYRRYQRALVAGNSAPEEVRIELPWPIDDPHATDLYSGEQLMAGDGRLRVTLPADSGRVFVTRDAYLTNCLAEAAGMAQSCELRVEELQHERGAGGELRAVREVFAGALRRAQACLSSARAHGAPSEAERRRRVAALSRVLAPLEELKAESQIETRLMQGGLTAAELPELMRTEPDRSFGAEVTDRSAILRAGGATFSFGGEGGAELRLAGSSMTLWVSSSGLEGDHGWLHAQRLEDVTMVAEEPDLRTVQFVVTLQDEAGQAIEGLDVLVEGTIRRGLPAVEIDSALRNHTGTLLPKHYWFWNIGARWHTLPDGTTIQPADWGAPGEVEWDYLHAEETGGGGLVVADFTGMGYGAGQADMFADPRNQDIEAGGAMPIRWTAWAVRSPWHRDAFLARRMHWYDQYASLAAEVVSDVRLLLETPRQVVAGAATPIRVRLSGPGARRTADVYFEVLASIGGEKLPLAADERTGSPRAKAAEYVLRLPQDVAPGQRVEVVGKATMRAELGPVHLQRSARLRTRPPVEVSALRQMPVAQGGLGLQCTLRNNLAQPVPVLLEVSAEGLPQLTAEARLPGDGEGTIDLSAPEADVPASAQRVEVDTTITLTLPGGEPASVTDTRTLAMLPQAVCQPASSPPELDGGLDDSCWQFATSLTDFVHHQTGEPASEPTTCLVAYDDANLYVAFDCAEEDAAHLRAEAEADASGLSPDVPRDDSVEIYVDPRMAGTGYFRLALNSAGVAKSSASGGWEVGTAVEDDRWIVEVCIPFDVIGAAPRPGDVWGFNACRNDQGSGEATAWSFVQGPYANPERFGGLLFAE